MMWHDYRQRQEKLAEIDARLETAPGDIEARFERARHLTELGRTDEARQAYLELLHRAPAHYGALNNFGLLLKAAGYRSAARTVFSEAVIQHPDNPKARVNLADLLRDEEQFDAARLQYNEALKLDAGYAAAHKGLALLLLEIGEDAAAALHQKEGFKDGAVTILPYRGQVEPIRVVLLTAAANGNAPFQQCLDDRIYSVTAIAAEFHDLSLPLPAHHLIVNAIGEADLCAAALRVAEKLVAQTKAPVVNAPSAVLATGRADTSKRLNGIPGLITPRTRSISKDILLQSGSEQILQQYGFNFPFLVRAPGYHLGKHFYFITNKDGLASAVAALPCKNAFLIEYLDASGRDGNSRKYRVMMIGGQLYPAHLAISRNWKIHYVTSDMSDNAVHRVEEDEFLRDMTAALGPRAMATLATICKTLALDYAGIDFGLDKQGNILLFEANAAMTIHAPYLGAQWDYRRAPIERMFSAISRLLRDKAMGPRPLAI